MTPSRAAGAHSPRVRTVLWRGVRRRCPHCGEGPLFSRRIVFHPRCPRCGLMYLRNQRDISWFWVVMDRIVIWSGIVTIYFGLRADFLSGLLFVLAIAVPLHATMRERQGVALALSYLSRVWFRDPSEAIPPPPGRAGVTIPLTTQEGCPREPQPHATSSG